jgi:hypothetical protein
MNITILRKALEADIRRQKWMADIQSAPQEEDNILPEELIGFEPFGSTGTFGWFELFVRHCLDHVPATSTKWADIAATYVDITGRRNFSNLVIRMLKQKNDIRLDTFGWIMRHNLENLDFLIEDLESISPVDLWFYFASQLPNITLWKSILFQYQFIEKLTENMFLSLYTKDAAEYYVEERISPNTPTEHMKGANSSNPFVLATYNFKALLESPI